MPPANERKENKGAYARAGVDIRAGDRFAVRIGQMAADTFGGAEAQGVRVLEGVGGFAAALQLPQPPKSKSPPVIVAAADGVGTKLQLAREAGRWQTLGSDLVAMCVNDIICSGALPFAFLDYYACGTLDEEEGAKLIAGIAAACQEAGCALAGGETAEMPGVYPRDGFDLAGFAIGLAAREELFSNEEVRAGDAVVGLASSGAHSNGFSLIRRILHNNKISAADALSKFGEELLSPTRIYVRAFKTLRASVDGVVAAAHITGGGLPGNLPRALPPKLGAKIRRRPLPPLFEKLQKLGGVDEEEVRRVFNCGIGFCAVVRAEDANAAVAALNAAGQDAEIIGEVTKRGKNDARVNFV